MSMNPDLSMMLARLTLYIHFLVVAFNVGGLVVVALGKVLSWTFVRIFWWRALHAFSMALVALQAAFGRHCFLTLIESAFERTADSPRELFWLDEWISFAVYWPLPLSVFVPLYLFGLAVTFWFWIWVRPGVETCANDRR